MSSSRRRFLQSSLASSTLVAMGATTVPEFLGRSARAAGAGKPNDGSSSSCSSWAATTA